MVNRARHLSTWARLGYAARGIVYLIIGWLAFDSNRPLSAGDAVQSVQAMPMGTGLLMLLALGLFGYGLYKVVFATGDFDGDGTDAKGLVKRGFRFVGGLAYWTLAFIAGRALLGGGGKGEEGQAEGSDSGAAGTASEVVQDGSGGSDALLLIIALAIMATAATQLYIAAKAKFMEEMAPDSPPLVKPAGQLGYAARGLVIAIVGWFALKAALGGERLRDFGDALAVVRDDTPLLFKAIAVGLILFGLVSLAMARYRHIRDADLGAVTHGAMPGG
jgi:hypothetical protein